MIAPPPHLRTDDQIIGYFKQATSSAVIAVNVESAKTEEIKSSILASGTLIYKEQGTIQFTDLLWNNTLNQMGWDTAPWDTTT